MEAQLEYWLRRWLSSSARFSVCLSFACILFVLLSPLTFMLHARLVSEETFQAVGGIIVLALVALVVITSAIATESLWRWVSTRRENP